jgi:DNA-binding phage protein
MAGLQTADEEIDMALTRSFKETVQAHARRDPKFAEALFKEAIELLLNGDVDTGKEILRDYINATIGFQKLAKRTDMKPESLMRMFSPAGNPTSRNLFTVVKHLQKTTGVKLELAR